MSRYKPYPAYKDSGVEWIGKIPEHWKICPVKHLYQAKLGKMIQPQPKSEEDVLVPYHRAQTVQWERIEHNQVEKMWVHPSEIDSYSLENGDLLICEGGDVCRASVFNLDKHETVIFQNSLHRVRPINDNRPEWLLRLMQHVRSSGWIDVLCNKNTIIHFTSDKLRSLETPHPPPSEQAEILSTLRRETARIDALIARKTEFIELLTKKRQALITHAVTKGLDPNVKMKDSGVEWIGEVPEHWKIRPVKHLYQVRLGKMIQPQPKSEEDVLVPYHRAQTVQWERIEHGQVEKMWIHPSEIDLYSLENGDLLICEGGDVCRASIFNLDKHKTVIFQNSLHRVRPINNNKPEWLLRLMQHVRSSGWIDVLCNKNTIVHFTSDKLRSLETPHPPPSEQAKILSTLRRETARIDLLIEKVQLSIDLLKKRRSALITAAVTGQIDLREST
jgi:type I restriction enzyme S subunit